MFKEIGKFFSNNSDIILAGGQLFVAGTVGLVSLYVYFYNRRRDKLQFFFNNWNKQQDINLHCMGNEKTLMTVEGLIYGDEKNIDIEEARAFTFAFLHLNKIQNNYEAMKQRIISKKEYLEMSIPTLTLFARQKEFIIYLVSQRGYSPKFRDSIIEMISGTSPYDVPKFNVESVDEVTTNEVETPDSKEVEKLLANQNNQFMESLYTKLSSFFDGKIFYILSYSFILNPLLLGAQLHKIIKFTSPSGLSIIMISGFAILNIVTAIAAVKIKNLPMFLSFLVSFFISATILAIMLFR